MIGWILLAIIFVILLLGAVLKAISERDKDPAVLGAQGERKVRRVIGETIEEKQYVINDLIIAHDGTTCQIDHIVINPRGIFVIETKNYSGRIYGSENNRDWTQVLAYGNVKNKLYNPLKQNATHVYNVRKIVGNLPVYSLVVFTQNNTEYIDAENVIPLKRLRKRLKKGKELLSLGDMKRAYEKLIARNEDVSTEEHIQNIERQQRELEEGVCPRCGAKLVLRNGQYGEFWGCSNYPKCKFIKKI